MSKRVLITGGRGLLGNAVVREAVGRGWEVVTLQRTQSGLDNGVSVRDFLGSITDANVVTAAMNGCDAVIHLAARVGIDGAWGDFERVNVGGTAVVLDAARRNDVSAFVHISSPSVAHAGEPLVGAAADPADPSNARGHYSRSKAMAEELVLGQDDVPAVALRPHLVWGPGDTQLVARIVDRARRGRLFLIDGGTALIDTTYIDNAASAICQGLARIDGVRGQALVVSNGEPRPVRDIIAGIVRAAGLSAPSRSVPFQPAWIVGAGAEAVGSARGVEPPLTRFLVEQLATAHWFDQRHTRAALEWEPTVGIDEGMARLQAWFRRGAEAGA